MTTMYAHSVGWANTPDEFKAGLSDNPVNTLEILRGYDRGREYWYAPNKQSVRIEMSDAGIVESIVGLDGSSWGGFSLGSKGQVLVGKKLP